MFSGTLKGIYSSLGQGEHYDYYKFDQNGLFEYHKGASLGDELFGEGEFWIQNDSLLLNYNRTPKKWKSYHQTKTWYNNSETAVLELIISDKEGVPIKGANVVLYSIKRKLIKGETADGNGKVQFEVEKAPEDLTIEVSYLGYDSYGFSMKRQLNAEIEVHLMQEGFGNHILDQKEAFHILSQKDDSVRLKGREGIILLFGDGIK